MINLKNILKKTSNKKTKVKTKKVVKKKTKLRIQEISYISPLWTYKLLTFLSVVMIILEIK